MIPLLADFHFFRSRTAPSSCMLFQLVRRFSFQHSPIPRGGRGRREGVPHPTNAVPVNPAHPCQLAPGGPPADAPVSTANQLFIPDTPGAHSESALSLSDALPRLHPPGVCGDQLAHSGGRERSKRSSQRCERLPFSRAASRSPQPLLRPPRAVRLSLLALVRVAVPGGTPHERRHNPLSCWAAREHQRPETEEKGREQHEAG